MMYRDFSLKTLARTKLRNQADRMREQFGQVE